jgi:two-component system, chemotaxis family, CheB/CheR fusion protein
MAGEHDAAHLIIIGASAGGIEAVSTVLQTLGPELDASVIIAQHLDPNRTSFLGDILARHSALPVRIVTEHEPLEPGVVFVTPANHHVEITDRDIHLRAPDHIRPVPSIDLLLQSAAERFGERLIAVILTGTGTDGTAGARYVKEAGGTVLIQNPATARYPAMPLSLAPNTVDIVAELDQIGGILTDLVSGELAPPHAPNEASLADFLARIRARSGIDFANYKAPTIQRRLQRRIVATGNTSLAAYAEYVERHPEEYERLVSSFLINVTEFFRDPELFAYLREQVLPELVARARARDRELRIWSAGCATGEEAYSLAILLAEVLGDELPQFTVRLFATDLDEDAVQFARRGVYPAAALGAMSPERRARFFTRSEGADGVYEVTKPIRSLIIFGQHDLGQRAPFPRTDLVLCRNVLIYFTPELQRRALQLFAFSLRDGDFLVLGPGETLELPADFFTSHNERFNVYRRHGERLVVMPLRPGQPPSSPIPVGRMSGPRPSFRPRVMSDAPQLPVRPELMLERLPAGVIALDRRYHIRAINIAARRMLGLHLAALEDDLLHLIDRLNLTELRGTIDAAFGGEQTSHLYRADEARRMNGMNRDLRLVCTPGPDDAERPATVTILLEDVTDIVRERDELRAALDHKHGEIEELARFREASEAAQVKLTDLNEQLSLMNLDLLSANEELAVERQEALTAMEEVETLNEELETTNAELEAVSEEQKMTLDELNDVNHHLEQRAAQLQQLTESLEHHRQASDTERARLSAVLLSVGDPIVVVDGNAVPILANPAYDRTFGRGGNTFLALDASGRLLGAEEHPLSRAARGESFVLEFTTVAPDGSRRRCEATGEPIAGAGTERGVLVIRDVTERSIYRVQDEFLALASHELRTPLSAVLIYLELLEQRSGTRPEMEEFHRFAERALHQAHRLKDLTGDLLDATRLQHGKLSLRMRTMDLGATAERAVEAAQTGEGGPAIRLTRAPEPITIHGDPSRIEQVVLNLLVNALAHSPGASDVAVRLERADPWAEIVVQDAGEGIDPKELPFVFDRFRQVQGGREITGEGLGLGLYIAREIIVAHGGTIAVDSEPGQGTTFTVRLPLTPARELLPY